MRLSLLSTIGFRSALLACSLCVAVQGAAPEKRSPHPLRPPLAVVRVMNGVTEATLRADLSFLSSDALEGRDTPSRGLDTAAEFIASRFLRAGLEAPVDGSYFQVADLTEGARRVAEHYKRPGPTSPVIGRNVIGILRGSDPELSKTYVIVSAHYDHIGTVDTVDGRTPEKNKPGTGSADRVYNGADDDGSGTVSVIALAEAFTRLKIRPRRSIIFMTFCGEELGLLGSNYYAHHPVVPLKDTIAEINLEQIGRTDGDLKKGTASLTGFTYTSLGTLFERAGLAYGMKMVTLPGTENYFKASDNLNFAKFGIPDTTICSAFEFPDYHGLQDEWSKIDYAALVTMNRIAATVLWTVANSNTVPVWNSSLKQTERFRAAARETYGKEISAPLTPVAEPEPSNGSPVTK